MRELPRRRRPQRAARDRRLRASYPSTRSRRSSLPGLVAQCRQLGATLVATDVEDAETFQRCASTSASTSSRARYLPSRGARAAHACRRASSSACGCSTTSPTPTSRSARRAARRQRPRPDPAPAAHRQLGRRRRQARGHVAAPGARADRPAQAALVGRAHPARGRHDAEHQRRPVERAGPGPRLPAARRGLQRPGLHGRPALRLRRPARRRARRRSPTAPGSAPRPGPRSSTARARPVAR